MKRAHDVHVRLSEDELAQLDEMRPTGMPRAVFVRSLLHKPPERADVASREEALSILTRLARSGKVAAAIHLARELRLEQDGGEGDPLDELLRRSNG